MTTATAVVFHLVLTELEVAIGELSKPPSAKPAVEQDKPPEPSKEDKTAKAKKGKVDNVMEFC